MIYVRDGLSFSNENSTLGDALFRLFAERKRKKREESEKTKTPDQKMQMNLQDGPVDEMSAEMASSGRRPKA